MNKRIHELIRESNLDVYGLGKERYKWEYTVEKFAELIIADCVTVISDAVDHREPASTYVDKIKNHFGVEQ
jgi:hypothetical protein